MTGIPPPRCLLLGLVLLVSYAWFYQGGGWNQNSRLDLVRALVEQRTVCIDRYVDNTGDVACVNGRHYSDKAPGVALIATPVAALARALGVEDPLALSYLCTLAGAALPAALACMAVYGCARRLGADSAGAALAALGCGLGSPFWCYATLFFGHALAGLCLTAGFAAGLALDLPSTRRAQFLRGAGLGLACGWAVVTEYPCAPAALVLLVWGLARARSPRRSAWMGAGLGVGISALVLVTYHTLAFGSPFAVGYSFVAGFPEMAHGFFGLTRPSALVLGELLVGSYRGLFYASPILLAGLAGVVAGALIGLRTSAWRVIAVVFAIQLLLNSAFAYWDGGWAYGPRHLMPVVPLLSLGLAEAHRRSGKLPRALLAGLAALSVAMNLVAVSTDPTPPQARPELARNRLELFRVLREPLGLYQWPAFRRGDLGLNRNSVREKGSPRVEINPGPGPRAAWNLGQRAGLEGLVGLLPLFGVWAAAGFVWWRMSGNIL